MGRLGPKLGQFGQRHVFSTAPEADTIAVFEPALIRPGHSNGRLRAWRATIGSTTRRCIARNAGAYPPHLSPNGPLRLS